MKIILLSGLPLLDRHAYKKMFLLGAREKRFVSDIVLLYGRTSARHYVQEIKRQGWSDGFRKWKRGQKADPGVEGAPRKSRSTLRELAKSLGIEVKSFDDLNSAECLDFLARYRADSLHNFSGQFLPASILSAARFGAVGGHYGALPEIRGTDAPRWNILLNLPLYVTHMRLACEMDMGDILLKTRVPVRPGDGYGDIYRKCQTISTEGHLALLDMIDQKKLTPVRQQKRDGSVYYRMGHRLREKVDAILSRQAYQHYV